MLHPPSVAKLWPPEVQAMILRASIREIVRPLLVNAKEIRLGYRSHSPDGAKRTTRVFVATSPKFWQARQDSNLGPSA